MTEAWIPSEFAREKCHNERRGREITAAFHPFYFQFPSGRGGGASQMPEKTPNSISDPHQQKQRNTAEFLYQGATVVAALLLVLSAAV
jgi:hypothetical protein